MSHSLQLLLLCVLAYVTLAGALAALSVFSAWAGTDLSLRSLGQEAALAAVACLIEGGAVWAILVYVPAAGRAIFIPALIVGMLYKLAHLEDWSHYDVGLLLLFQVVIAGAAFLVFSGHFAVALLLLVIVGGVMALVGSFIRGL